MTDISQQPYTMACLVVLDGFGVAPATKGNAVAQAEMPFYKQLCREYPYTNIQAAGEAVGLPWGEMGNSEVGHMNLGMGRIAYQDLPRINNAIRDGSFFKNEALNRAVEHVQKNNSQLHVVGMLSNGAIHSLDEHLYQVLVLAKNKGIDKVFVHAILDGRDTPAKSGVEFLTRFQQEVNRIGVGTLATCGGRYFAMDRDNRWDRVQKAYDAMTKGSGPRSQDALAYLAAQYEQGGVDETVEPFVMEDAAGKPVATVRAGDSVIYTNFRTDRARQLTEAFVVPGFEKFERGERLNDVFFVTMVEYESGLPVDIAFPPIEGENSLAKVLSDAGYAQVHIAETEKFAHVTNFFDGALGAAFPNEEFILVPSPQVAHYDEEPEMSAPEITNKAQQALGSGKYQFALINFANPDMVGHTGNMTATLQALEYLDKSLAEIVSLVLSVNGVCFITGDHGNAEEMLDTQSGEMSKEHTANPVPLIIAANNLKKDEKDQKDFDPSSIPPVGILSDVAPTILEVFGIAKPQEMSGNSLLKLITSK